MEALSRRDKSMIDLKLKGARIRMKACTGRFERRKPFGRYLGEAAALERIKALRANGVGFDPIAARLNAENVATRTGKPWHGVVISRILRAKRR